MPKPISQLTRERFITTLKTVYPEAMSRNGIREVIGIWPKTLEVLIAEYKDKGIIEEIRVRGGVSVFRWRSNVT